MTQGHSNVTRTCVSSDLPRHDISVKGRKVRDLISTTFTRESGQHQCEVAVFFALLRRGFAL